MHRNVSNVWWLAAVLGLALAACGSDSTAPSGRPAAGQIAFSTDRDGNPEIYVVNADGSGLRNLTNNPTFDFELTWSPDGTKIALSSDRDGDTEIYLMHADGTDPEKLTNNPGQDRLPDWPPDGPKIA